MMGANAIRDRGAILAKCPIRRKTEDFNGVKLEPLNAIVSHRLDWHASYMFAA